MAEVINGRSSISTYVVLGKKKSLTIGVRPLIEFSHSIITLALNVHVLVDRCKISKKDKKILSFMGFNESSSYFTHRVCQQVVDLKHTDKKYLERKVKEGTDKLFDFLKEELPVIKWGDCDEEKKWCYDNFIYTIDYDPLTKEKVKNLNCMKPPKWK